MDGNIEIKARIRDLDRQRRLAEAVADVEPEVLCQEDTFFNCPDGRLKLRVFADGTGELIYYKRADCLEPTESRYVRSPTNDPEALKETLANALGVRASVRKRRTVYWAGRTRIHIDDVDSLGWFIEIEVVLRSGERPASAIEVAETLMAKLEIDRSELLKVSYVDILLDSVSGRNV